MSSAEELRDWATSGAMWLTGRSAGPPVVPPGRGATTVRESLATLGPGVPAIPGLLGERAAHAGLGRNAPWSCGGAFRTLAAADGWVGLSLARPTDIELLPALVEGPVGPDPWAAVAEWAGTRSAGDAQDRLRLLGLPGGRVPDTPPDDRPGVLEAVLGRRTVVDRPLVVDFTSLWAGPLCAHLLGLTGACVVKVESVQRPDGARSGPPEFFRILHDDHDQLVLDFATELDRLHDLVASADLVLEASRPRALQQLGLIAEDVVAAGTSWLSITARGRSSDAVGFGDDVAASAGLVHVDDGTPVPVGDAIADPLSGVAAAVAGRAALDSEDARLIDVSMLHVAAETVRPPASRVDHHVRLRDGEWWLDTAEDVVRVERPRTR
ncbi:CoA transferase [Nocardioides panacihumi]|uniref:CoA transferase n=1 Tax=Nocardioides panacihumi TaxID=400774 RepID=A0ABN2RJH3_9ACTN